ncbi:CHAT domain-containing protein [Kitasatospora sp. NPDC092948]|uniref:CHAT domain-containing protein n=1 Tax=Kitasatospora sp. NPDC092948 TaxID=3364088 RepID=UPI003803DB54
MNTDEALALLADRLDPAEAEWFDTPEAHAAAAVLRAAGVPPAADLPLDHALVLGYSDLFAFWGGGERDPSLLGEGLLCLLAVRRGAPERVAPEFAEVLAVADGEQVAADAGPGVGRAHAAGAAMMVAFHRWRHPGVPALAVRLLRRAAAGCPPDAPLRGEVLSALGVALLNDHVDRVHLPSLAEAVRVGRAAVAAVPDGPGEQARRHAALATALRFWSDATLADGPLREAVSEIRTALRLCPPDDPRLAGHRNELGLSLAQASVLFGDHTALPEAVELLRESLRAADPAATGLADRLGYAERLCYLGVVLIAQAPTGTAAESGSALRTEGVALCRQAVAAAPVDGLRAQYLSNLCLVLLRSAPVDDADATALALAAARDAAELAPAPTDAVYGNARLLLALALTRRYLTDHRPADLAAAVARATESFEATPPSMPAVRTERGSTLANLRGMQAAAAGRDDPSGEALTLLRRLVAELPDASAERAQALRHLADLLLESAGQDGRDERAAEALDHYRECLRLPSPGPGFEADVRFSLGTARAWLAERDREHGNEGGDGDGWQRSVASMRRAITLLPAGDPRRIDLEYRLGAHWLRHAQDTHDPAARAEGVRVLTAVVAADRACPAADRVLHRSALGAAALGLADDGGSEQLVDGAVGPLEQALDLVPVGDPRRPQLVDLLAGLLSSLAWMRSDTTALDRAADLLAEALSAPDGNRADHLTVLGRNLRLRFHLTGDPAHLERGVECHREAIALTEPDPDPVTLSGLATCLANLHGYRPEPRLRAEATACCRAALDRLPEGSPDRAPVQADLGYLEWSAAAESGSAEQLDAALDLLKAAVSVPSDTHNNRGLALTNLGVALFDRANRTGDRSWQLQAAAVFRAALEQTGPSSALRPMVLNNLAMALIGLSAATGEAALREQALALLEEAAAPLTGMPPARERAALNLAWLRYGLARADSDLDATTEAVRRLDELVADLGSPHPLRTLALARLAHAGLHLANLLPERAARTALRRAAAAAREALADHPPGADPAGALARQALALAQLRRASYGDRVDLAEAVRLIRRTAEDPAFPSHTRLEAAQLWGSIAARTGRSAEALRGFSHAVALLPVVAPRHLARLDQEDRLASGRGLASAAAALAIRAGDPARALALLEQGRGVLLAQGLDNQGDLSRLRELDPARAAEFERIRDRLSREHPLAAPDAPDAFFAQGAAGAGAAGAGAAALRDAEERHALSRRWDQLLDEIRALPELDDFLRPPTTPQLLSTAERGPVVVVNVSEYGSHALVLLAPAGGRPRIDVLPLPDVTPVEVAVAAQAFTERLIDAAYGDEGVAAARHTMSLHSSLLEWLWDAVAAPVLDRLGLRGTPLDGEEWPRLWWCPTGRLAFLPLHAAGKGRGIPGTWVMDRVVSSYTPTLRSLLRARRRSAAGPPRRRPAPLVVSLAQTPGGPPLPGAEPEAALVAELFPAGLRLDGGQATVERVRDALYRHSWVHFCCHGVSDPASPSNSGLILHDGRLSALALSARRPADAELAFLSACSTSQGGLDLPDEAVHLAPSFQLAGFTHVIGTLWSVSDRIARSVTADFYATLHEDAAPGRALGPRPDRPFDPALALHHAVRSLRERLLPAPHLWAAHMHIGP